MTLSPDLRSRYAAEWWERASEARAEARVAERRGRNGDGLRWYAECCELVASSYDEGMRT